MWRRLWSMTTTSWKNRTTVQLVILCLLIGCCIGTAITYLKMRAHNEPTTDDDGNTTGTAAVVDDGDALAGTAFVRDDDDTPCISLGEDMEPKEKQLARLSCMGCRPRLIKVPVDTNLVGTGSDRLDNREALPSALPVKRCHEDHSYCGNQSGKVTGYCCPSAIEEEEFRIILYNKTQVEKGVPVYVESHVNCSCQSVKCVENRTDLF